MTFLKQTELVNLVAQLSLEEKIGQLQQLTGNFYTEEEAEITGPMTEVGLTEKSVYEAGSVLGLSGAKATMEAQSKYLSKNRLQIPLLFMADIVHGYRTIFPIPLGLASSWNPELVKKTAQVAAVESAVSGLHVTFSPMVDLVRDPRWGRVMESTGEDPYLNQLYAKAFVEGYQGDLANDPLTIAACVKHFAAYGAPEGGREYNTVNMSDRQLRESYLPAYQAALEAGCKLVMTAFNTVDGIPATANRYLNRDILRKEFGFKGVLISDWAATKEVVAHGVAANEKEAAALSLEAGVDIEMMAFCYQHFLKELVAEGKIATDLIDEAVLRILELKNDLGLFENPYRGANEEQEAALVFSKEHQEIALQAARESIVLLENKQNVLPLQKQEKVAFVGPFVEYHDLLGNWSWKGNPSETETIKEVASKRKESIEFVATSGIWELTDEELTAAHKAAEKTDKIILFLGETADMSGEASSRTNIQLPTAQLTLLRELKVHGKPIVVVTFNGRPLDLTEVAELSDGLVEAWFPGTKGAQAVTEILFGETAPTGRLTMSFPRNVGQIPVYYNHFNTGRPIDANDADNKYVSKYLDVSNEPLYPFGYGLSYDKVSYQDLVIQEETIGLDGKISASVTLQNNSNQPVTETVQWYVRDIVGEVVRPMKELKGFETCVVPAGESKLVTWEISVEELAYIHVNLEKKADAGEFVVMVGSNSSEVLAKTITVKN